MDLITIGIGFGFVFLLVITITQGKIIQNNNNRILILKNNIDELIEDNKKYKNENNLINDKIVKLEKFIQEKDELYSKVSEISETNLKHLSILYSDHLTLQYELAEKYLSKSKSIANIEKTIKIRDLKIQTKEHIAKYKLVEYKYAYLLSMFPELEMFTDNVDSLIQYNKEFEKNLDEIKDDFDRTISFLSKEEYSKLTEEERNQLALDRYIKGCKSNWQIGRDYEMYIGYCYEKENYDVEYYGIENNLNDLGRDIIAIKGNVTKIIQCKYWSQEKLIREKHIAQLYGTTIQYILSNKIKNNLVVPVLITNTKLSDTAKEFAKYLNVEIVENKPIGEYPRIKCHTNRDSDGCLTKIYHLPFDQLYDRTKISRKGDLYAFSVKEAMDYGFRRAKKYFGE